MAHEALDLSPTTLPLVESKYVTKIELDKETLIRVRSKLLKGCCAIEREGEGGIVSEREGGIVSERERE